MQKKKKDRRSVIFLVNSTLIKQPYYSEFTSMQLFPSFPFFFARTLAENRKRNNTKWGEIDTREAVLFRSCFSLSLRRMNIANFHGSKKGPRTKDPRAAWKYGIEMCVYAGGSICSRESFSRGEIV